MKILKIDFEKYTEINPRNGYKHTYCYEEYIFISFGGETTKSYDDDTIHIELKGQGCRKFEELGGSWLELLEYSLNHGKMRRIDLAYDDFTGTLDYDLLIYKTENHEFSSVCKSCPVIMYSKDGREYKSFSITFGSRTSSRQLQIYDKKTERESKDFKVINLNNWTRIEARFKEKYAEEIKELILISLYQKEFDKLCKGLIKNIVEYKEKRDKLHSGRGKNWKVWDKLLDQEDRVEIKCQYDLEKTITKKANWLKRSVSKTLKTIYLSNPNYFYRFINYLLSTDLEKLENIDLSIINNVKDNYDSNLNYESVKEMVSFLRDNLENYSTEDEYIENLIGSIRR